MGRKMRMRGEIDDIKKAIWRDGERHAWEQSSAGGAAATIESAPEADCFCVCVYHIMAGRFASLRFVDEQQPLESAYGLGRADCGQAQAATRWRRCMVRTDQRAACAHSSFGPLSPFGSMSAIFISAPALVWPAGLLGLLVTPFWTAPYGFVSNEAHTLLLARLCCRPAASTLEWRMTPSTAFPHSSFRAVKLSQDMLRQQPSFPESYPRCSARAKQ
ncbi:hypothetical protein Q7P37_008464 [Cladosporium fusiforme]